jgi:aryl carrier-like protein
MRFRRENGLPGTTMNVGAVTGLGVIAENEALQKIMERMGMDLINEEELLYLLEEAVTSDHTVKTSGGREDHQLITGISLLRSDVDWATKPLLKNLYANHDFGNSADSSAGGKSLIVILGETSDITEKTTILLEAFMDKVSAVLATPRESIVPKNTLSSYGLDSIVAVEFRKWFRNSVGVDVPLFDILGAGSIGGLCEKAVAMLMA